MAPTRKTIPTARKTFGPRRRGGTFFQDIMRGESSIPADGRGPGVRKKRAAFQTGFDPHTPLDAGPAMGLSKDGSRKRNRRANAQPSGGGGGPWAEMNTKLARTRAQLQQGGAAGGLAIGTQGWVQEKIADGDISGGMAGEQSGTSIFDPVLCELVYRWFCPAGGLVLDPFAGGSVRGVVASKLKRRYVGTDLRPEQIAANQAQGRAICDKAFMPRWLVGDSIEIDKIGKGVAADLIFSCPPYADLEVYSEDPRDLSTMEYAQFREALNQIVAKSCSLLKADRFAVFVVGDARDSEGFYYGLPAHTIDAFVRAGLRLYNRAILVTACGSLPIRVRKQFETSRKFGNTHQEVLVFAKGNPVAATQAIGAVEFGDVEGLDGAPESEVPHGGQARDGKQ
jgi:DNA methylase